MRHDWEPKDHQVREVEWMETEEKNYKLLKIGDLVRLNAASYPQYKGTTGVLLQTVGEGYWEVLINGDSHPYRIPDEDITEFV